MLVAFTRSPAMTALRTASCSVGFSSRFIGISTEPRFDPIVQPFNSAAAQLNGWTIGSKRGSVEIPMKRELKPTEHEAVLNAVMAGDRVKATSIYLSATEGNLTDAQKFVKTLALEIKDQRNSSEAAPSRQLVRSSKAPNLFLAGPVAKVERPTRSDGKS